MSNIYRAEFNISGEETSGPELFDKVKAFVLEWTLQNYPALEDSPGEFPFTWEEEEESLRIDYGGMDNVAFLILTAQKAGCEMAFDLATRDTKVVATLGLNGPENESIQGRPHAFSGSCSTNSPATIRENPSPLIRLSCPRRIFLILHSTGYSPQKGSCPWCLSPARIVCHWKRSDSLDWQE